MTISPSLSALVIESQDPGQHCGCARDLLLLMHGWRVWSVGFEVISNALSDKGQERQQIVFFAVLVKLRAQ